MKYRRLPVIVDAWQWSPYDDPSEYPDWLTEAVEAEVVRTTSHGGKLYCTLEMGTHVKGEARLDISVGTGAWIIKYGSGRFETLPNETFNQRYESLEGIL